MVRHPHPFNIPKLLTFIAKENTSTVETMNEGATADRLVPTV